MLEYSSEEEFIGLQGTNGAISAAQVPEEPFHHNTSCLSYDSTYVLEAFFMQISRFENTCGTTHKQNTSVKIPSNLERFGSCRFLKEFAAQPW